MTWLSSRFAIRGPGRPKKTCPGSSSASFAPHLPRYHGGLGLGLTSTPIAEAHGGAIAARNVGGGTCFTVRLPLGGHLRRRREAGPLPGELIAPKRYQLP